MQIRLEMGQERFLTKESMVLRVFIRNDGPRPLRVPNPENGMNSQPHYTITGPSYRTPFTFSATHPRGVPQGNTGNEKETDTVEAAPGATVEGSLSLEQILRFEQPGGYTILATMNWAGASIQSQPVHFTVEEPHLRGCTLMVDDGFQLTFPIRVACLNQSGNQTALYQAVFQEARPDLGEISLAKLIPVKTSGDRIAEVIGLWANFDRFAVLMNKFVWRSNAALAVQEGVPGATAAVMSMPAGFDRVVRPALVKASGEVSVLLLFAGGREMALARFPVSGAPALAWRANLPFMPEAMRSTLIPAGHGGGAAAILLARGEGEVRAALVESGDAAPRVRTATISNLSLPPQTEPALRIEEDGTTHASFIAAHAPQSICVVDLVWTNTGDARQNVSEPLQLDEETRAAAVTYPATSRDSSRRDWVALLNSGAVVGSGTARQARRFRGTVVVPLELLAMSQTSYVLTMDPQAVLKLAAVH